MAIYYMEGDERRGPLERQQFIEKLQVGGIKPDTLIYTDESGAWKPYREAYNDLFPNTQGSANGPSPEEIAAANDPTLAPSSSRVFMTMYGPRIIVATVFFIFAGAGYLLFKNYDKLTQHFTSKEIIENIEAHGAHFAQAAEHIQNDQFEEAQKAYEQGQPIFMLYYDESAQVVQGDKTVEDLIQETHQPVNDALIKKFNALLDRYEQGDAHMTDIEAFFESSSPFYSAQEEIYDIYLNRIEAIDAARAAIATKLFRLQFVTRSVNSDVYDPRPDLNGYIQDVLELRFKAPDGYRVTFGEPAGPMEMQNTLINCEARISFYGKRYYYDANSEQLIHDTRSRPYGLIQNIVNRVDITLFNRQQRKSLQKLNYEHNWEPYYNFSISTPLPEKIPMPKSLSADEMREQMAELNLKTSQALSDEVRAKFRPPSLKIKNL
ncbi:DUF4339 domain-containing protein [Cerasicoccus frondis]|uniref:DUF4339 domain-containing protein n=1 Tax=Cerasicoccus frondis TaxID=490090 RepID=UPI002852D31A|nr:DUF4339 domain-containing protein [Cerasicoccus frondis]